MLCNKCGKNEATHFIEKNINGKVTKLALCARCAEQSVEFSFDPFEGLHAFDGLFGFPQIGSLKKALKREEKRCSLCGSSFDEIVKAGKIGCAKCYDIFADELNPIIKRIHGDRGYVGRKPGRNSADNDPANEDNNDAAKPEADKLSFLKDELRRAVETENYERAAELRDEIRRSESE